MFLVIYKAFVKLKNYFWVVFFSKANHTDEICKKPVSKAFYQNNYFNLYSCFHFTLPEMIKQRLESLIRLYGR